MKADSFCVIVKVNKEIKEWTLPQALDEAKQAFSDLRMKYFKEPTRFEYEWYLDYMSERIKNIIRRTTDENTRLFIEHISYYIVSMGKEIMLIHSRRT